MKNDLKGRRVILVGLGRLGGGIAAAKYFASRGAKLTVTDALDKKTLAGSIRKLKKFRNITYKLGKQQETDFKGQEIAIFNSAVPIHSPLVKFAKRHCKEVHNDLSYFLSHLSHPTSHTPYIGVTGTRGKTTVTTWIGHFLKPALVGGNMPDSGLFKILSRLSLTHGRVRISLDQKPIVLELSSFQLEFMRKGLSAPHVAVITNLYQDHLNRHGTLKKYLETKALLFKFQTKNDFLILNADNPHTEVFLKLKPRARICMVSLRLPRFTRNDKSGLCAQNGKIIFIEKGKKVTIGTMPTGYSSHMQYNLLGALLAAHLWGVDWKTLMKRVATLPQIPYRQELVLKRKGIEIYNDSAATSPEGAMAAIDRFKGAKTVFIFGGTDKLLDFASLAAAIERNLKLSQIYLLDGSGTKKLIKDLGFKNARTFKNLEEIVQEIAKNRKRFKKVVFSPGAASFEKFKNEFDRGKRFNGFVRKYF